MQGSREERGEIKTLPPWGAVLPCPFGAAQNRAPRRSYAPRRKFLLIFSILRGYFTSQQQLERSLSVRHWLVLRWLLAIRLRNLDILLHDEFLEEYQGAMAVNAGDNNTVRDIKFEDVFIEEIRQGQIFNVRVFQNKDYNPVPGKSVERVCFKNVKYAGPDKRSLIAGFAPERLVREIVFENCFYNGQLVERPADALIEVGDFTENIQFLGPGSQHAEE